MFLLPKKDSIITQTTKVGLKGLIRFKTLNKFSGKITQDTGWFPNLILNNGLQNIAVQSNFLTSCQVGTNNSAPDSNQTSLQGYLAGTSNIVEDLHGQQSTTAPYYGYRRLTYRHSAGTVAANLSEVGIGWGTTGDTLLSRARIVDPITQLPTTITPLSDEILDVSYELRYYPPTSDVTSPAVTLNGITYNTLTRAAEVNTSHWSTGIGSKIGYRSGTNFWAAYDGAAGTVLQNPSGTSKDLSPTLYNATYSNNSNELVIECAVLWANGNLTNGIRTIRLRTTAGSYQTQYTAVGTGDSIPKTTSHNMLLKWLISWEAL